MRVNIISTTIAARFPNMESGRVEEIVIESARVCEVLSACFSDDNRTFASDALRDAMKCLKRNSGYARRDASKPYRTERNPAKPNIDMLFLLSLDKRFVVCLSHDSGTNDLFVDVSHFHNPKGAGRKHSRWPKGIGGRGNVSTLQIPKEIAPIVQEISEIIAWSNNKEEIMSRISELLSRN